MSLPLRTFRRIRSLLWTAVMLVLVGWALIIGLGKLLLPYSDRYKPALEAKLSELIRQPVKVKQFSGDWKALGPQLEIQGFQVFSDAAGQTPEVTIENAALDIHPINFLIPGRPVYRFQIIGADLEVLRDEEGKLRIGGVGLSGRAEPGGKGLGWLNQLGDVVLSDARIFIDDRPSGIVADLKLEQMRLRLRDQQWSAQWSAYLNDDTGLGIATGTANLELEGDRLQSIQAHVQGSRLDLHTWLPLLPQRWKVTGTGNSDLEAWLSWDPQQGLDVLGRSDSKNLNLVLVPGTDSIAIDASKADWHWQRFAHKRWNLSFANLEVQQGDRHWQNQGIGISRNPTADYQMWVWGKAVDLGIARQVTQALMYRYRERVKERWLNVELDGFADDFELLLDQRWRPRLINAVAWDTRFSNWPKWPGIAGADAVLNMQNGLGDLQVTGEQLQVTWPKVFKQPVAAGQGSCDLRIQWDGPGQYQVGSEDCRIQNQAFSAGGKMTFTGNGKRPLVDWEIQLQRASLGALGPYWADAIMSPATVSWLRRALVSGQVNSGVIRLQGDLDDWPFQQSDEGNFIADLEISNSVLDYTPGWPRVNSLSGRVNIHNQLLSVETSLATIQGVDVSRSSGRVHMRNPVTVVLDIAGGGDIADIKDYVLNSPLQQQLGKGLSLVNLQGPADIRVGLEVFPKRELEKVVVDGSIQLNKANLTLPEWRFNLDDLEGELGFTEAGLNASNVVARYQQQPVSLALQAGPEFGGPYLFSADMNGKMELAQLLPEAIAVATPMLDRFSGASDWQLGFRLQSQADGEAGNYWLDISSGLQGIAIDLPEPLRKTAQSEWPLRFHLPLGQSQPQIDFTLADQIALQARLSADSKAIDALNIGLGMAGLPPLTPGKLNLTGAVDRLNLDGWSDLFQQLFSLSSGQLPLQPDGVALEAKQLILLDRRFQDVAISLLNNQTNWEAIFNGEQVSGRLRLPKQKNGAMVADFDRLLLPDPEQQGITISRDPREMPTLHLFAKEFEYAGLALEDTRIEAWPQGDGLHFETVEGSSGDFNFRASGDWALVEGQQRSSFDIVMTAESLGSLLQNLDINAAVDGGQTLVQFNAWWPGSPAAFALAELNGQLDLSVIGGQILNAQPGAGRLLGLISLEALPRRLALDFRDVFDRGFAFDEANGSFALANGVAHTENLQVKSAAAVISVSGRTDLAKKAYDQVISVRPGVGSTLPVLGAIAGGPGGAAAGIALQQLFKKPISEATQVQYSIKGSWSEPVVTPIAVTAPEPVDDPQDGEDSVKG